VKSLQTETGFPGDSLISSTNKDGTLAKSNYQYEKRQRELIKKKKKEEKKQRKLDKRTPGQNDDPDPAVNE